MNYPILILPFISKASEILGKRILVEYNKSSFLTNFNKSILSKNKDKKFSSYTTKVTINFLENKNSFTDKEWKDLYKVSQATFVEENESLKSKGAGAGLTDND